VQPPERAVRRFGRERWFTQAMSRRAGPHRVGDTAPPVAPRHFWRWTSSRARVAVMLVAGAAAAVVAVVLGAPAYAPLAAWDTAAAIFVAWVWAAAIVPMSSTHTSAHATREDPGSTVSDVMVLVAAVASLGAVAVVLVRATSQHGAEQDAMAAIGVGSVALSWFAVHTLYTLRYARLYYAPPVGGVDFNPDAAPRYLDFAYLAFTLGMTFQVSDTNIEKPSIRATVLRHSLLSYLFGSVILATTINLIAGLGSG
jgi:uncharacterized membrane protein